MKQLAVQGRGRKKQHLAEVITQHEASTKTFVPEAINRVIDYEARATHPAKEFKADHYFGHSARARFHKDQHKPLVFQFVLQHFNLPEDLEHSMKYGPRSGSCFEERVLTAYMNNQLPVKQSSKQIAEAELRICIECGQPGHFPAYCPAGF